MPGSRAKTMVHSCFRVLYLCAAFFGCRLVVVRSVHSTFCLDFFFRTRGIVNLNVFAAFSRDFHFGLFNEICLFFTMLGPTYINLECELLYLLVFLERKIAVL